MVMAISSRFQYFRLRSLLTVLALDFFLNSKIVMRNKNRNDDVKNFTNLQSEERYIIREHAPT